MMMNTTLEQLRGLRLHGMASGLQEQMAAGGIHALSFEERLALLVERELHQRDDKKRERLLKEARLKYPQAAIENLDGRPGRGIDRPALMSLVLGDWIESGHSVLITGPTGAGKSWLACALAQYACRRGHTAVYQRVPRLGEELRIRHGNGTFGKWLLQLAKTEVLLLDDCWKSSTTGRPAGPPSSPASCPSSTGMPGWATPRLPMQSWTGCCSGTIGSH
jgi:DNA replication protein DnaC